MCTVMLIIRIYKSAYEILSGLNKKEMSEMDVTLLITETYMYTKNKLTELESATKDIKTQNPYIQFEIAYMNSKWKNVLLYIDDI